MKSWEDKFNILESSSLKTGEFEEWRFSIEENKTKGTLQLNARKFKLPKTEGGYCGPTKNGFIETIEDVEQLQRLQDSINDIFEKSKKLLQ